MAATRPAAIPPPPTVEERLAALERTVAELREVVGRLDGRTASDAADETPVSPRPETPAAADAAAAAVAVVGRAVLGLAGAFLIRAVTEAAVLPRAVGAAVGLAYALAWLADAEHAARSGDRLSATLRGVTGALVAFPLSWEAAARFSAFSPLTAAALSTLFATLLLWRAAHHALPVLAWITALLALAADLGLLVSLHAAEVVIYALIVLGIVAWRVGLVQRWPGLAWLPALAADLVVFEVAGLFEREGGPPGDYAALHPWIVGLGAALLAIVYLGGIALGVLREDREAGGFEWVQTALGLIVGLSALGAVLSASGHGSAGLGAAMLLAGSVAYATGQLRGRSEATGAAYFGAVGAGLVLWGGAALLRGGALAALYAALAVALSIAARAEDNVGRAAALVALFGATVASGLWPLVATAALAPAGPALPAPAFWAVATALVAAACHALLRPVARTGLAPLLALAFGLAWVAGAYAAIVLGLGSVGGLGSDPAALALVRCVVPALAAVGLAARWGTAVLDDLRFLVYPLLVVSGFELAARNLSQGRPATLFIAFAVYGIALRLTARLLRQP